MKAVLVTGGGTRIGAGIAKDLGCNGWCVFVHYNTSRDEAEAIVSAIRESGGTAQSIQADLRDLQATMELVPYCAKLAASQDIPLTALINNASLFSFDSLETMTAQSWASLIAVNLQAPLFLTQEFAKQIPENETGCVINMLDNKVFALNPDFFSYTIGKVGLHGATRTMAMALAPRVRVCGIAPGIVLRSGKQTDQAFERAHRNNPLGKGATVPQIVDAVRFILATPSFNGNTITIDGGQMLRHDQRDLAFLS